MHIPSEARVQTRLATYCLVDGAYVVPGREKDGGDGSPVLVSIAPTGCLCSINERNPGDKESSVALMEL